VSSDDILVFKYYNCIYFVIFYNKVGSENMSLLNFLKRKKKQLLEMNDKVKSNVELSNNIEIIIEDNNNLFENEIELIKQGAINLFENGNVDSIEEGIKIFAVMFRGLKYKRTEKDENGNIKIILKDIKLENSITKKL